MINDTKSKEVNWDRHTATLRTARVEKTCSICRDLIPASTKCYSIVIWGAGLAGKKFPDYTHLDCLEEYKAKF